jgi:hypothetical protein
VIGGTKVPLAKAFMTTAHYTEFGDFSQRETGMAGPFPLGDAAGVSVSAEGRDPKWVKLNMSCSGIGLQKRYIHSKAETIG